MLSTLIVLFVKLLGLAISLWSILILLRIIMSWVNPCGQGEFYTWIFALTEPILRPLRVVVSLGGVGLDLAPLIALIIFSLIERYLIPYLLVLANRL